LSHSLSSEQLEFNLDGNANPDIEFGECCCYLNEVQEIAAELTCVDFAVWCHLTAPHFSEV
jgi:hypothetical protein